MAAGGGAGGERGSRERRRGAGPGSANGARAGGSLKPLSGGRGSARPGPARLHSAPPRSRRLRAPLPPLAAMDVTGGFFGKLRDLAVTVEKEVKQLERAMRREDAGKSGHGRHAWA